MLFVNLIFIRLYSSSISAYWFMSLDWKFYYCSVDIGCVSTDEYIDWFLREWISIVICLTNGYNGWFDLKRVIKCVCYSSSLTINREIIRWIQLKINHNNYPFEIKSFIVSVCQTNHNVYPFSNKSIDAFISWNTSNIHWTIINFQSKDMNQ
jgi:hypothetical protein